MITTLILALVFFLYNETFNLVKTLTNKTPTSQENKKFLNLLYQPITYK
ncbi:hypothetical protein [Italian clover phyllody phytoplasma]|nr:hypothetical protein [Italian clover phyllody phytoplasma]